MGGHGSWSSPRHIFGDSYFVQPSDLFSWLRVLQHLMPWYLAIGCSKLTLPEPILVHLSLQYPAQHHGRRSREEPNCALGYRESLRRGSRCKDWKCGQWRQVHLEVLWQQSNRHSPFVSPFVLVERFGTNHSGSYHDYDRVEMDWTGFLDCMWLNATNRWQKLFFYFNCSIGQGCSKNRIVTLSRKLENYKSKDDLLAAVEGVDAMIIRSDIVDAAVLEKAKQLKIVVRAGAGSLLQFTCVWLFDCHCGWKNQHQESKKSQTPHFS